LTFGVLWLIGLYCIKFNQSKFLKNSLYILQLMFLQIFIATDSFRSLFLAFPNKCGITLDDAKVTYIRILVTFVQVEIGELIL
jgi:hypothetical protein